MFGASQPGPVSLEVVSLVTSVDVSVLSSLAAFVVASGLSAASDTHVPPLHTRPARH
jgi:hypothetical protein